MQTISSSRKQTRNLARKNNYEWMKRENVKDNTKKEIILKQTTIAANMWLGAPTVKIVPHIASHCCWQLYGPTGTTRMTLSNVYMQEYFFINALCKNKWINKTNERRRKM